MPAAEAEQTDSEETATVDENDTREHSDIAKNTC